MQRGRRHVRCTICTSHRWLGNNRGRFKEKDASRWRDMKDQINKTRIPSGRTTDSIPG